MGKILKFKRREDNIPHLDGPASCKCGFEWEAVVPVGTKGLTCPECGSKAGFKHPVMVKEGDLRFVCDCGSELFSIVDVSGSVYSMCSGCGTHEPLLNLL